LDLPTFALLMLSCTAAKLLMPKKPSHACTTLYTSPKLAGEASSLLTFCVSVSEADTLGPCALYCPLPQAV
jgi:hypothetical protein